jgi:hypothetical protein
MFILWLFMDLLSLKHLKGEPSVCLAVKDKQRMVTNHEDEENFVTSTDFSLTVVKYPNHQAHTSQDLLHHQLSCFLAEAQLCIIQQTLLRWKTAAKLIYLFILTDKHEAHKFHALI